MKPLIRSSINEALHYGVCFAVMFALLMWPRHVLNWLTYEWAGGAVVVGAVVGGAAMLTIAWIRGWWGGGVVIQDGTLCPACGYPAAPSLCCSECGRAFTADDVAVDIDGRRTWLRCAVASGLLNLLGLAVYYSYPTLLVADYLRQPPSYQSTAQSLSGFLLSLNPWRANAVIASYLHDSDVEMRLAAASPHRYLHWFGGCSQRSLPVEQWSKGLTEALVRAATRDPDDRVRAAALAAASTNFAHPEVIAISATDLLRSAPDAASQHSVKVAVAGLLLDGRLAVRTVSAAALRLPPDATAGIISGTEVERRLIYKQIVEAWREQQSVGLGHK